MTKQELIDRVAKRAGIHPEITKKTVIVVVEALFSELGLYFIKARTTPRQTARFAYPGFGTFTKKIRSGRMGRNPRNGEPMQIPPAFTLMFTPGVEFKRLLNRVTGKRQQA
jgi:nucleoid DNA-binding protein